MPITQEEFGRRTVDLEKEITGFLKANMGKAYTSDEIMSKTSFHTEFDFESAPRAQKPTICTNFGSNHS